ncbi:unnamed protein product [Lactuca virosa]|uniref:Uncharacterized protein n=1 Tax=Lactuca virosa TaxID=75947 RepID=A0AAU9LZJ6_9ASTR|nr:unnamed protein product [Lactuca virosa]
MKHYTSERCDPPSAHSTTPPIKTYKPSSAPSVFVYDQQIIDAILRILYAAEEDALILIYLVFTMLDRILLVRQPSQFGLYLLTSLVTKWLHAADAGNT